MRIRRISDGGVGGDYRIVLRCRDAGVYLDCGRTPGVGRRLGDDVAHLRQP